MRVDAWNKVNISAARQLFLRDKYGIGGLWLENVVHHVLGGRSTSGAWIGHMPLTETGQASPVGIIDKDYKTSVSN